MKFLLAAVNAKYVHTNPAVYSLAAYAKTHAASCHETVVREYTINRLPGDILAAIYAENPDAIGFSCYIWNWNVIRFLLRELPKVLPETRIFLGGPEVSFHSEKILSEFPQVEAVMIGEGEQTFAELLDALPDGSLEEVKGLMLRSGFTGERAPLPMDSVPFFYGDISNLIPFQDRILYYESSRGCPYCCSYCLSSIGKTLRVRSFENVKKHLDFFLSAKVPQVKFIDRTFNAHKEHALSVWTYLKEHDNGVTNFHFEIAADLLSEEEVAVIRAMRPGLIQLEIGVQSTNAETLAAIRRHADTEKIRRAVSALRKAGNIHIHLDLIAGLPFEDRASFLRSFNEVFSMGPHELQLGFLKVLKGTAMEEKAEEYGLSFLSEPPYEVLSTKWISYEEVREFHRVEEMVEVYYNSCQFTQTLPLFSEKFPSPYDFFLALAGWYASRGYFVQVPSRSRRYEILLEFAASLGPSSFAEKIREALSLDYYLREKPRRLPSFVTRLPDLSRFDYDHRDPVTGNCVYKEKKSKEEAWIQKRE